MIKIIAAVLALVVFGCSCSNKNNSEPLVEGIYFMENNNCEFKPIVNIRVYQNSSDLSSIKIKTEAGYSVGVLNKTGDFFSEITTPDAENNYEKCEGNFDQDLIIMDCDKTVCNGVGEDCNSENCHMEYKLCEKCNNDLS